MISIRPKYLHQIKILEVGFIIENKITFLQFKSCEPKQVT